MYLKCAVIAHFKDRTADKNYKSLTNSFVGSIGYFCQREKKEQEYHPGKCGSN